MWKNLRERFQVVHVLHLLIPTSSSGDILRGVPEVSRLSPTFSRVFVADLIHALQAQLPCHYHEDSGGWGKFSMLMIYA